MAIVTPEQKEQGKTNFANELSRRQLLKGVLLGAGAALPVTAATYFGYEKWKNGIPVKAALIGSGDEGGVLVGEHNPDFMEFVAVCDIRPSNMRRIFDGDPAPSLRKGFKRIYGEKKCDDIKRYTDYQEFLIALGSNNDIEAVVIALPLSWHAKAAIDCMRVGKERQKKSSSGKPVHVLCEKLMAWNISQCKEMIATAKETGSILSIGHQRHYSLLYAHALEAINCGMLGEVRHIRALWHRNQALPFKAKPGVKIVKGTEPFYQDSWCQPVQVEDDEALKDKIKNYKYDNVEQLIRWRLFPDTGGGLMAELGSHQLDACSIFLGKVHPLNVTGTGVKSFYRKGHNDRTIDDHVFVTYEFPGKNHPRGPNKGNDKEDVVVVTYSSINTNGFEPYGETVMGTRGTMVVEMEQSLMFWVEGKGGARSTTASVAGGGPALDASSTAPTAATRPEGTAPAGTGGKVSRGYREEMEDFAFCIKQWDAKQGYEKGADGKYKQRLPRCHGEVAMADAIVALLANRSMALAKKNQQSRIEFKDEWFQADSKAVPPDEGEPKVPVDEKV